MLKENTITITNMIKIKNLYEKQSFSFQELDDILNTNWVTHLCNHIFFKNELIKKDVTNYVMKIQARASRQNNKIFLFNIELKNVNLAVNADIALRNMLTEFNKFYISLAKMDNVELSSDNIFEIYNTFKSLEEQKILNNSINIETKDKNKPRI